MTIFAGCNYCEWEKEVRNETNAHILIEDHLAICENPMPFLLKEWGRIEWEKEYRKGEA